VLFKRDSASFDLNTIAFSKIMCVIFLLMWLPSFAHSFWMCSLWTPHLRSDWFVCRCPVRVLPAFFKCWRVGERVKRRASVSPACMCWMLNHSSPRGMRSLGSAVNWPSPPPPFPFPLSSVVLLSPGRERNVRGWEAWSPHVCVWVDSALYQYPPLPQRPAEAGYPVRCDCPGGGQGVPRAPVRAGGLQRVLPPGAGGPGGEWLGR